MNLLVFSGLVLEVIDSLPEESDTEQAAVVVFKEQPGGEEVTHYQESWIHTSCLMDFSRFSHITDILMTKNKHIITF